MLAQGLSLMFLLPTVLSIPAPTADFKPWLKPTAPRIEITSSTAVLRECGRNSISWQLEGVEGTRRTTIDQAWTVVPLVTSPGGAQLAAEGSHLWDVRGTQKKDWRVDYPEGTSVVFYVSTWLKREGQKDLYVEGRSANMTVKEGKRRDCIPASHWPIVVDLAPLQALSECSIAHLSWSGGKGPYSIYVDAELPSVETRLLATTEQKEAEWKVDFPVGSTPRLTITDRNGWSGTLTSHLLNITSTGAYASTCIPRSHLLSPPWYTSLNAILAFSLVGGMAVMLSVLLGGKACIESRRRKERGERERLLGDSA